KITWIGQHPSIHPVEALLLDYDYLVTKRKIESDDDIVDFLTPVTQFVEAAIVDANVGELEAGSIIQLERRGYFIVDKVASMSEVGAVTLIRIPDGKAASMASKHVSTGEVAVKSAGNGSNPWDKGKTAGKKAKSPAAVAAGPSDAEKLGLPGQADASEMYKVGTVYGNVALEDPSTVSEMYATKKIY
ncbi:glutamate--tRNA ligase, partial [Coemansia aciculifera]